MSNEAEAIFNAALQLPVDEREALADRLFRSLDHVTHCEPTDEQIATVERRLEEVRTGKVQTIAGDEAYQQVIQRLREQNGR